MPSVVTSTNMLLPVPVVGVESGPQWATDINNCLGIIDQHNHSSGSGVQITPSGLNINSDLTMGGYNLTTARTLRLQSQSALFSPTSTDLGCLYEIVNDLYYRDGVGNQIRITQSGSVSGASGTITGLPSGTASVSYAAGTYVFQAATSTGAIIDGSSFILRNTGASSFGLSLFPPSAMGANYSLVLPALPASTRAVNLDTSGNMGTITYDGIAQAMTLTGANAIAATMTLVGANAIAATMTSTGANAIAATMTSTGANTIASTMTVTGANTIAGSMSATGSNAISAVRTRATGTSVAAGGVASSASCGTFTVTQPIGSGLTTVTNLSVTITTSGRPVMLLMRPDLTGSYASIYASGSAQGVYMGFLRDGSTPCGSHLFDPQVAFAGAPPSCVGMDFPAAGTYTYTLQAAHAGGGSSNAQILNCMITAYEL